MSETALAPMSAGTIEAVIARGDLAQLTPAQRVEYYMAVCASAGIDWRTKPFDFLKLENKIVLYPTRNATDQLRQRWGVSVTDVRHRSEGDLFIVTAEVRDARGRRDAAIGVVSTKGLAGAFLANAMMKAETKAKRRATLSLCGLLGPDESEIDDIADARRVSIDVVTGEYTEPPETENAPLQPPRAVQTAPAPNPEPTSAPAAPVPALIDREQWRRIQALNLASGKTPQQLSVYLFEIWGLDRGSEIHAENFDEICEWARQPAAGPVSS